MIKRAALKARFSGLGFRLMAVMGIALLPLALLSYVQSLQTERLALARVTNAIKGETLVAAVPLVAEVFKAQGKAGTISAMLPAILLSGAQPEAATAECRQAMVNLVASHIGMVTFAGFISRDGQLICGSIDSLGRFADSPALKSILDDPRARMTISPFGPISKTSVLVLSHPVVGETGEVAGIVMVALPHLALERQTQDVEGEAQPLSLMTFDQTGAILTSSIGMERAADNLPIDRELSTFVNSTGESFVGVTATGQRRAFAVVPVQMGTLYLLGSWPADRLDNGLLQGKFPAFLFPVLMWAASLLVAFLAAESQVLRHVRSLRDSITAFAGGKRQLAPLSMDNAALELRSVGRAYERMTEAVLRNEADLENTIHQKEVLLREVHHRVKNNLQLIASILNMQLRSARTNEAKEAMRTVQDRVISLATVHRELYQTSGLTDVQADELLPRVARDLLRIGSAPGRRFDLDAEVDDIRLTPDQAVPLALFLTEGMANVIKHAWSEGQARSRIGLRLERNAAGAARFTLCNSLSPSGDGEGSAWTEGSDGFGSQLLMAFAQQLKGQIIRGRSGDGYVLSLEFPLRPLTDAEERRAAAAVEEPSGEDERS
ncbi:MAG: sensor histidine kinase [Paracoccaceae bacterium]